MLFIGPPTITTHPTNKVVNASVGVTLNCRATSKKPITYQWEYIPANKNQWSTITGGNSGSIFVRNLMNSEKYRCKVSNEAGSTISNIAVVTLMGKLFDWQWNNI